MFHHRDLDGAVLQILHDLLHIGKGERKIGHGRVLIHKQPCYLRDIGDTEGGGATKGEAVTLAQAIELLKASMAERDHGRCVLANDLTGGGQLQQSPGTVQKWQVQGFLKLLYPL